MLKDPQVVRIETSGRRFDETMVDIRAWLHRQNIQATDVKISTSPIGFEFEIGFGTYEEAERFRAEFAAGAAVR